MRNRLRELGAGSFVGLVDADGRPLPLSGLTVQLATHSRVLVIDARRLAVLIDSDPAAAAAWQNYTDAKDRADKINNTAPSQMLTPDLLGHVSHLAMLYQKGLTDYIAFEAV